MMSPVVLWGSGAPGGDTVRVSIAGQTAVAHSDWQGRWMVRLAPMKSGGPFQMVVQVGGLGAMIPSSAANTTDGLELNDVLIGEVLPLEVLQSARTPGAGDRAARTSPHPFAFVRVRTTLVSQGGASWHYAFQDAVPKDLEAAFALGGHRSRQSQMPVGVVEELVLPRCAPSTGCSAH